MSFACGVVTSSACSLPGEGLLGWGSWVAAATPALVETRSGQLRAISRSKTSDNCQKLRSLRVAPDNMASTGLGMRLTTQNMTSVQGLCGQRGTLNKPLPCLLLSEDEFCPSSPGLPRLVCVHLGDSHVTYGALSGQLPPWLPYKESVPMSVVPINPSTCCPPA